jgi:hypothetical protein
MAFSLKQIDETRRIVWSGVDEMEKRVQAMVAPYLTVRQAHLDHQAPGEVL